MRELYIAMTWASLVLGGIGALVCLALLVDPTLVRHLNPDAPPPGGARSLLGFVFSGVIAAFAARRLFGSADDLEE
jgi:hypothetical protein